MAFFSKLFNLLSTYVFFGFIISLYYFKNSTCGGTGTEQIVKGFQNNFSSYFVGSYFTVHVSTWYVVFAFFYRSVVDVGLRYLISWFKFTQAKNRLIFFFAEFFYGFWAASEILAGWCDLQHIKDCIANDTSVSNEAICESGVIRWLTSATESICERLTSEFDEAEGVYKLGSTNTCLLAFQMSGHLLMTLMSCLFTFFLMCW